LRSAHSYKCDLIRSLQKHPLYGLMRGQIGALSTVSHLSLLVQACPQYGYTPTQFTRPVLFSPCSRTPRRNLS
jgi:hypothetical protein